MASAKAGLPKVGVHTYNGEQLATAVNWVTKGAVTQVKDHLKDPRDIPVYVSSDRLERCAFFK